jgi:hypothetical protein
VDLVERVNFFYASSKGLLSANSNSQVNTVENYEKNLLLD